MFQKKLFFIHVFFPHFGVHNMNPTWNLSPRGIDTSEERHPAVVGRVVPCNVCCRVVSLQSVLLKLAALKICPAAGRNEIPIT
jgi:hypothetical protein